MPTPTSKDAKQALYAVAGVADLAVSTIRHLPAEAAKMRDRLPDEAVKTYGQLVRRGETLVTGVRRSRPTRQATEATRNAVSRTKAAKVQVQSLATALELYKLDNGRYPTTFEGLKALVEAPQGITSWNGPYLAKMETPIDPWGRPFTYRSPGKHAPYEIISLGADNQPGGTGEDQDIASW